VKLLVDENLSYRMVALLALEYPGSLHVRDAGLRGASYGAVAGPAHSLRAQPAPVAAAAR
jgi:predicted nuclease of predicted toxin-antitoxin system